MCGRYHFAAEKNEDLFLMLTDVSQRTLIKTGEIFPSDRCLVLTDAQKADVMQWGFPGFKNKSDLIINARSETVTDKQMFRKSFQRHRCVIPVDGFYEWDKAGGTKTKYFFHTTENRLYLAGIWGIFQDVSRFVILTTEANTSMAAIHNRMPLMISEQHVAEWIGQPTYAIKTLDSAMPSLSKTAVAK